MNLLLELLELCRAAILLLVIIDLGFVVDLASRFLVWLDWYSRAVWRVGGKGCCAALQTALRRDAGYSCTQLLIRPRSKGRKKTKTNPHNHCNPSLSPQLAPTHGELTKNMAQKRWRSDEKHKTYNWRDCHSTHSRR